MEIMSNEPIVTIKNGSLKGCIKSDYQGKAYYSFQGIPYAKPPLGELRFKPPQAAEPWTGIRDATKEGNACYSMNLFLKEIDGSEDCLFLNVYTPNLPVHNKPLKPVMVWIHGGGFIMESGNSNEFGPDYLIPEDVVLVTINYRLGLLGFLSFDDTALGVTGNAGLKDQVMALKWINENVSYFGEDPDNVTIFGESAGGASVDYLILSPLAKGLFHNAILQSGTALSPWALCDSPKSALEIQLGMSNSTDSEILQILLAMPVERIFELQQNIPDNYCVSFKRVLGPVIESKEAQMPFLTEHPLDILQSGNYNQCWILPNTDYNHVPMMIGFTSREGMVFELLSKLSVSEWKFDTLVETGIPYVLNIPKKHEMYKTVQQKIKNFYYGSEEPTPENANQYFLLQGDACFIFPAYVTIKHHNSTSNEPIFLYRMSIESKLNVTKNFIKFNGPGSCHADDLGYLFKNLITSPILPNSTEQKGIEVFTKLWTQFAKTGNPNAASEDGIFNVTWKPVETNRFHYLEIGENVTVGVNPDHNRVLFWESIYDLKSKDTV